MPDKTKKAGLEGLTRAFREAAAELESHEEAFRSSLEMDPLDLKRKLRNPDHLRAMKLFSDARRDLLSSGDSSGSKIVHEVEKKLFVPRVKN